MHRRHVLVHRLAASERRTGVSGTSKEIELCHNATRIRHGSYPPGPEAKRLGAVGVVAVFENANGGHVTGANDILQMAC
jgi:hypothetical protein